MHCIHCGALLPEGAKFCTSCGEPVQPNLPSLQKFWDYLHSFSSNNNVKEYSFIV